MSDIKNFEDFLNESLTSDNDLNIVANIVIDRFVDRYLEYYDRNIGNLDMVYLENGVDIYNSSNFVNFLMPVLLKYDELKYSKKISKEFLLCLKKSNSIRFSFKSKYKSSAKASFDNDNEIVFYVPYDINEICIYGDRFESLRKDIIEKPNRTILKQFFTFFKSSMIHELQHYLDKWRSFNKKGDFVNHYLDKKTPIFAVNHSDEEEHAKYLKLSHEISARYTQTLNDLVSKNSYSDFDDLFWDFKTNFKGWSLIDDVERTRLIKRLSQYYNSLKKTNKRQDITNIIKDFSIKNDVMVHIHGEKYLDLYENDILDKEYEDIIPKLIKISNIYRYDIVVYKFDDKKFVKYLKSLGFVENKGKNIDFSLRLDSMYYRSKRK